jgi:hypothetical protein
MSLFLCLLLAPATKQLESLCFVVRDYSLLAMCMQEPHAPTPAVYIVQTIYFSVVTAYASVMMTDCLLSVAVELGASSAVVHGHQPASRVREFNSC